MRIVYLSNSIIPSRTANSIQVMKMCQALSKAEHEVILFSSSAGCADVNSDELFSFYDVEKTFKVIRVPCRLNNGWRLFYEIMVAIRSRATAPDIIYGRSLPGCYLASKWAKRVVLEAHSPFGWKSEWMLRRLLNSDVFERLIVITHALKGYYLQRYPSLLGRVDVLPDGSDENIHSALCNIGGRSEALRVGYVGHLYKGKGMEVIEAVSGLAADVDFHVIGGLEDDIKYWSSRIDATNVYFHGYVEQSSLASYINALDICLLPNQRLTLPFGARNPKHNIADFMSPLKMFEYMSHRKPIVASNLPVLREILKDGYNCLLCEPDEPTAWASAIARFRDDISLRNRLGSNARHDIENKYSWDRRTASLIHILARH